MIISWGKKYTGINSPVKSNLFVEGLGLLHFFDQVSRALLESRSAYLYRYHFLRVELLVAHTETAVHGHCASRPTPLPAQGLDTWDKRAPFRRWALHYHATEGGKAHKIPPPRNIIK